MAYNITNLKCSTRTIHALHRAWIRDIRQLYNMSDKDLLKVRHIGPKSLADLKQGLNLFKGEIK